jgi:uncharacterized protein (TIRG00374 family)
VTGRVFAQRLQQLLPPSRYRDPRDLLAVIAGVALLAAALITVAAARDAVIGPGARAVSLLGPGPAAQTLVGIVQVAACAGAAVVVLATLLHRRFRLFAGLLVAGLVAAAATAAILALAGGAEPARIAVNLDQPGWLAGAAFPGTAAAASAAAVFVGVLPWASPAWRRAAWVTLLGWGAIRLLTGTALPMELALAAIVGLLSGFGVRLVTGVPDRRAGPEEIAAALAAAGLRVLSVSPARVRARGSRPFVAIAEEGQFFIKALGADQRYADLLYRGYRALRLKHVGDVRPAASLLKAVEHQALLAMLAERAGVSVPRVHQIVAAQDGTTLLVMDLVDGSSLDLLPAGQLTDDLLRQVWTAARTLHHAQLAHRSLRAGNIMIDKAGLPYIVDFSFAELPAARRQQDIDVAELLASLAVLVGPDRTIAAAAEILGADQVAAAAPLLQPMALSAATRRAAGSQKGLLARTRSAAAAAGGTEDAALASIQRVRPRTLLSVAAAAAAFYFLLPQLAEAAGSWRAVLHADWAWMAAAVAASVLTYVASAIALAGCVPTRLRFLPTLATQFASSFINRISPANIGGMALNVRFLQKSGVEPVSATAAVGVNSLVGAIVHFVLIIAFFTAAGQRLHAFALPSGSKLLLGLAVIAAIIGLILATRPGRRFAARRLLPALRSSAVSLGEVARRPVKLGMLFGGSALITLAYIAGLAASTLAFGGGASLAAIGAVYLGASAVATASGSPGGLGALEAALVAGLTGIGIRSGVAVPAVLSYRLATYWLPVAPGWAALQLLQRRGLV